MRVTRVSDNVVLYDNESEAVKIDGHEREYKISSGIFSSNEKLNVKFFLIIKNMGAENAVITIKEPFLYQGNISDIIDRGGKIYHMIKWVKVTLHNLFYRIF